MLRMVSETILNHSFNNRQGHLRRQLCTCGSEHLFSVGARSGRVLTSHHANDLIGSRSNHGWFQDLKFLGQAKGLFLVFEAEDHLVLIDQHAAHERVVYERLKSELGAGGIRSQSLLVSQSVDLGRSQFALL